MKLEELVGLAKYEYFCTVTDLVTFGFLKKKET
jgi:hypothetical protein